MGLRARAYRVFLLRLSASFPFLRRLHGRWPCRLGGNPALEYGSCAQLVLLAVTSLDDAGLSAPCGLYISSTRPARIGYCCGVWLRRDAATTNPVCTEVELLKK